MTPLDDVTKEFLVESHENLDQLDRDFLAMEAAPPTKDQIASIFRTIHTIKGTAGFLGFRRLESLAHAGETLLSRIREGELALVGRMTASLLTMVDVIREMLRAIENHGNEGETEHQALAATLLALADGSAPPEVAPAAVSRPPEAAVKVPSTPIEPAGAAAAPLPARSPVAEVPAAPPAAPVSPPAAPAPPPTPAVAAVQPVAPAPPPAPPAPARPSPPADADAARNSPPPDDGHHSVSDANLRVDIGLLDKLMNLVGELVLARNQLVRITNGTRDPALVATTQRLNLITTEIQTHVMKTRMQPIGNVWSKLPRVVRDVAVTCGKQVRVEMTGRDTELDRTVLDAIRDPLTHIVRNAVDHGIESPQVRATRGKPRTGTLSLKAFHEGGQVNIEISDDGGGLDIQAIRQRAVERNLLTSDRAARMSPHELMQLIFLPGFSTAAAVTSVSGRGVGMDVVKTKVEAIGGTVDLQSAPGAGTTLLIKIPLTLAIIPALMVSSGGERFAVPQPSLLELVHVADGDAQRAIEYIHGAPVFRLRGRLLPLVYLNDQLHIPKTPTSGTSILVLEAVGRRFGLVVDEIHDTEEIVVKALRRELKGIQVFAGATIMGDGKVALILDVLGLAHHAGAVSNRASHAAEEADAASKKAREELRPMLLFGLGTGGPLAVPLEVVARLEEFDRDAMERVGTRDVVQYRDEILPIIDVCALLGGRRDPDERVIPVIVYSEGAKTVGLAVGAIHDVVDVELKIDRRAAQRGIEGAAVIGGKVIALLDVRGVIQSQDPSFFSETRA